LAILKDIQRHRQANIAN